MVKKKVKKKKKVEKKVSKKNEVKKKKVSKNVTAVEGKSKGQSVFGGEDKLITQLKKEHEKILFLAKNLGSFLEGKEISKTNCMLSLLNLKRILEKHLNLEDRELYPAIEESKDVKIRAVGKKFSKEMLGISKVAFNFLNKYSELKVESLGKDEKFKKELGVILDVVGKRIDAEEKILFPAYLKKPLTTVAEKKEISKEKSVDTSLETSESIVEEKENLKDKKKQKPIEKKINVAEIAKEIKAEQISKQRKPLEGFEDKSKKGKKKVLGKYVLTGVPGFDDLMAKGIPKGNAILVAGGAGSGKTIFSLQTLVNKAKEGKKCLYMSFEERESRLISHMKEFGWGAGELIEKGNLKIQRINPFDITRNVDAMLAKQKGELLIDIDPVIIPKDFKPDFIALDSLTAIASAFTGKEENYRIYIEQLFRFFEKIGATSFLITETEQIPKIFSKTGVEEFLADGVVVFYNLKHGNVRENAIEILKLRGAAHQKKIVAMQITGKGIVVYPEQEVFSEISEGD
jgi:KaiC/GvpD/RAD55 family RecA-like ATPase/hemerythrin-like domain-containing protein